MDKLLNKLTNKPIVSIVIPTFNGSKYLSQAIESTLVQTFFNFELIIVDDGSVDNSPAIIDEYMKKDQRINYIRNEKNIKLPGSLNVGFSLAQGEYYTWLSDDNMYKQNSIEVMLSYLLNHKDVDIVYSDYSIINEQGIELRDVILDNPENLLKGNCIGACFLYKREVHERLGGYSTDLYLAEDYDFWLRASVCFKIVKIEKNLYFYRQHKDSLSSKRYEAILTATEKVLVRYMSIVFLAKGRHKSQAYLSLCNLSNKQGKKLVAINYFLKSFFCNPLYVISNGYLILLKLILGEKILYKLLKMLLFRH